MYALFYYLFKYQLTLVVAAGVVLYSIHMNGT